VLDNRNKSHLCCRKNFTESRITGVFYFNVQIELAVLAIGIGRLGSVVDLA
jgi:hypothetical protein